jgi:hypothetical protein
MTGVEAIEGDLNANEQAYLNNLLKGDNPVLTRLKGRSSPNDDVTGA